MFPKRVLYSLEYCPVDKAPEPSTPECYTTSECLRSMAVFDVTKYSSFRRVNAAEISSVFKISLECFCELDLQGNPT